MSYLYLILIPPALFLAVTLWNALAWPEVGAGEREGARGATEDEPGALSILIPARDEEKNLAACLDAALAQGAVVGEILIYDDDSSDRTPAIIEAYARKDERVRVLQNARLPAGWCGKNFACWRLAEAARSGWMLYLDADARLAPYAAEKMLREARRRRVTLLSCWPALEARGFWERLLMPMLNFVVFTLYPAPLSLRRRDASLGLAHGACLLVERETYFSVGGHSSVRGELYEDVRLAQEWRERGEASLCLDGQRLVRVRMYDSLTEIWRGFQKNFYPAFRRRSSFVGFMALHLFVFLLPFVAAPLFASTRAGRMFAASAALVLLMRAALAFRFRQAWWSVALHPLSEALLIALGLSSWLRCASGRGVSWKGRRYRTAG
jgi:glycosyltransferase involved in cell wall biosynthesis